MFLFFPYISAWATKERACSTRTHTHTHTERAALCFRNQSRARSPWLPFREKYRGCVTTRRKKKPPKRRKRSGQIPKALDIWLKEQKGCSARGALYLFFILIPASLPILFNFFLSRTFDVFRARACVCVYTNWLTNSSIQNVIPGLKRFTCRNAFECRRRLVACMYVYIYAICMNEN